MSEWTPAQQAILDAYDEQPTFRRNTGRILSIVDARKPGWKAAAEYRSRERFPHLERARNLLGIYSYMIEREEHE
jgi:hypothetical protein